MKIAVERCFIITLYIMLLVGSYSCTDQHLIGDKIVYADSLYNKGVMYEKKNHPDSAFICYKQAINLLENSKEYERLIRLYSSSGEILSMHEYYADAIEKHKKALSLAEKSEDTTLLSQSYCDLGRVYRYIGQYDTVSYYYSLAQSMFAFVSYEEKSAVYNDMADVYLYLEQYDSALYYNEKAIETFTNEEALYHNYSCRGDILEKIQQYDSAKYYHKLALQSSDIYLKADDSRALTRITTYLGEADSAYYAKELILWSDSLNCSKKTVGIGNSNYKFKLEKVLREKFFQDLYISLFILIAGGAFALNLYKKVRQLLQKQKNGYEAAREKERQNTQEAFKILNRKQDELTLKEKQLSVKEKELIIETQAELTAMKAYYQQENENLKHQREKYSTEQEAVDRKINEYVNATDKKAEEGIQGISKKIDYHQLKTKLANASENNRSTFSLKEKEQLYNYLKIYFNGYLYDLQHLYFLTEEESLFCVFAKLNFSPKQYKELLNLSESAIRMRRKKIKDTLRQQVYGERLLELIFEKKKK